MLCFLEIYLGAGVPEQMEEISPLEVKRSFLSTRSAPWFFFFCSHHCCQEGFLLILTAGLQLSNIIILDWDIFYRLGCEQMREILWLRGDIL